MVLAADLLLPLFDLIEVFNYIYYILNILIIYTFIYIFNLNLILIFIALNLIISSCNCFLYNLAAIERFLVLHFIFFYPLRNIIFFLRLAADIDELTLDGQPIELLQSWQRAHDHIDLVFLVEVDEQRAKTGNGQQGRNRVLKIKELITIEIQDVDVPEYLR